MVTFEFYFQIPWLFNVCSFTRLARREKKKGKEIETWNGSPGMVQGCPQCTLLAVAASRAKDKGGPTLSSVPTLRYLLYMPFRDTIRSACGSNGSHVSRVHVYPAHNENLPPLLPPFAPFYPTATALLLLRRLCTSSSEFRQRITEAPARRRYSTSRKAFASRYPRAR